MKKGEAEGSLLISVPEVRTTTSNRARNADPNAAPNLKIPCATPAPGHNDAPLKEGWLSPV